MIDTRYCCAVVFLEIVTGKYWNIKQHESTIFHNTGKEAHYMLMSSFSFMSLETVCVLVSFDTRRHVFAIRKQAFLLSHAVFLR